MNTMAKNASMIVLAFGVLFLLLDLFVPRPATAAMSRAERVGSSWGASCWKESGSTGKDTDPCSSDLACRNCCNRKKDRCKRKYPNSTSKCENYWTFCMDIQRKPPNKTSVPGGTGFTAPSGSVQQTPTFGTRLRQMRIQQYFQWGGIRSRGIESEPKPVYSDPVPMTRPTLER